MVAPRTDICIYIFSQEFSVTYTVGCVSNKTKFMKLSLWKMEEKMKAIMKPTSVIRELNNKGVLSYSEVKRLEASENECEMNLGLVDILKSETYRKFQVFIEALHTTDQGNLVEILKSQGE